MRVSIISTVSFVIFSILSLNGQQAKQFFKITEHQEKVCATDIIHQRMLLEEPEYKTRHEANETALQRASINGVIGEEKVLVHTVPVVVHVFHTGEAVGTGINISDAQIQSAIDGMNEDYRKEAGTNGDGAGVDVEMQFCLASRDPNGNPTDGIIRVDASSIPNYASEGISVGQGSGASETNLKALSKWNRNDYYNIWIVNEIEDNDGGAGIQGFAYFPASSASKDGAVILYNAFGTIGTLKSYTNLNRTATHEIGHAFYLYHTFQGNSCSEVDCNTQGDYVCDTPPTTVNTGCPSPACSGTQQVENYMDYTHETCMNMFTQGQKDRMRNSLTTTRASLLTSLGCTPPNAIDAGISNIISPVGLNCSASMSPVVELKNFGSVSLTSAEIKYREDSGTLSTYSFSGNIASGETELVTLPSMTFSAGSHSFEAYTESPNGGTDGYQSNDSFSTDFEVVSGTIATVSITVDNYGNETTWDVKDAGGTVVASGGPYPPNANGTTFETDICLALECYDFTIYDTYGDGICCGNGFGAYHLSDSDGNILVQSGVDFDSFETSNFCMSASANPPVADFGASTTDICQGSAVQFNDMSSGSPDTWSWTFSGGSPASSSNANPSVTFNTPGTKTVTLTVSNGNGSDTETKTGYISVGSDMTISETLSNPNCWNSSDGAINISISGGTGPFQYSWSNGASSQDIDGLDDGSYTVSILDDLNCTASESYVLDAPSNINASNNSTTIATCANDGTATVIPSGGTSPYTYLWNDPNQQTTGTATGLAAGSYAVVITDNNGCQKTKNLTVAGTSDMDLSSGSKTNVTCNGESDGSATVNPSGGSGNYTFTWNDPANQSTATATGLSSGNFLVTVTDGNGCQSTRSFSIQEPTALEAAATTITPVSCNGLSNGGIQAAISGGTSPYTYHWSGAGFGQTMNPSGVSAGTYTLVATDDNGCSTSEDMTVTEPTAITSEIISVSPDSCNMNVGRAEISVSGGTGQKSIQWDDQDFQTGAVLENVRFGMYMAEISDENQCDGEHAVEIENLDCVGTTSVDENVSLDFGVAPNPVMNGVLNIHVYRSQGAVIQYIMRDITGKSVIQNSFTANNSTHRIELQSEISEGIYLLQLTDGVHTVTERVIVIR